MREGAFPCCYAQWNHMSDMRTAHVMLNYTGVLGQPQLTGNTRDTDNCLILQKICTRLRKEGKRDKQTGAHA
jgi:hypothetical protein